MPDRRRNTGWLILVAAAVGLFSSPARAELMLQLFADPPRLSADSHSTSIIIAQVREASGGLAADGTVVSFTTSLGSITPAAETRGGVARAVLTSGSSAGTALVSALAGGMRSEMEVEFTAGGETQGAAAVLRLEGGQVTYNRQSGTALVTEDGRFEYGSVVIRGAALQCDLAGAFLSAQGNVEISNGKDRISADAVVFNARQGRGSLLRYEGEAAAVYTFYTPGLKMSREDKIDLDQFRPPAERPSRVFIVTRRISLGPDGQAVFDDASVFVEGVKLISLPHYVVDSRSGDQGFLEQAVGLKSGLGLTADFPYYFLAKPGRIGLLRITHNLTPEGGLTQRGWVLNFEEQYLHGKGQGTVNLDDPLGEARGLRWNHSQELSPTLRAFASVRCTRFDANSPRVFDAAANFSKTTRRLGLNLSLLANSYSDSKQYGATFAALTHPRPVGASGFSYSAGLQIGYTLAPGMELVSSPEEGSMSLVRTGLRSSLGESVSLRLQAPRWKPTPKTTVNTSLALTNAWSGGNSFQTLSAVTSLYRKVEGNGNLGITYGALLRRSGWGGPVSRRQSLSCNLGASKPGKWETYAFASYQMEMSSLLGSGTARYYLPFQRTEEGDPRWALSLSGVLYRWQSNRTSDLKVGLARALGNWEVSLNYSPHGSEFGSGLLGGSTGLLGISGYGYSRDLGRTLWLEVLPRSF